jgi:cytochrome c peroxidase
MYFYHFKPKAFRLYIIKVFKIWNMKKLHLFGFLAVGMLFFLVNCSKNDTATSTELYPNIKAKFGDKLDLNNLYNYAAQTIPSYITKDNIGTNTITNKGATLGRVLFYDVQLSSKNTIACASCHKQSLAFSDTAIASIGVNGTTSRHSMRLINTRFAGERKFFWDERAASIEMQTSMPIKDHNEMGYSGTNGDETIDDLIKKLSAIGYYKELFKFVYGSEEITESKIQLALSQFIKSIQSFDSKYDAGRALVANDAADFTNFSAQENTGKRLFLQAPTFDASGNRTGGGLGCAGCHRAPEFDIDPNSKNNGIIGRIVAGGGVDVTNTRAPSLRDVVKVDGSSNGPFMHTGNLATIQNAIGHYGTINIAAGNTNLDPRLTPGGVGQKLNLNATEVNSVIAFFKTLAGSNVYTDVKWSSPF